MTKLDHLNKLKRLSMRIGNNEIVDPELIEARELIDSLILLYENDESPSPIQP